MEARSLIIAPNFLIPMQNADYPFFILIYGYSVFFVVSNFCLLCLRQSINRDSFEAKLRDSFEAKLNLLCLRQCYGVMRIIPYSRYSGW